MTAGEDSKKEGQAGSLQERVSTLERELADLRRTTNRRNWVIETLLVLILLMGATAWILFKG